MTCPRGKSMVNYDYDDFITNNLQTLEHFAIFSAGRASETVLQPKMFDKSIIVSCSPLRLLSS